MDDALAISVAAYSEDPEGYAERYASHRLDRPQRFAELLDPPARILDAGCGPGRDLEIFRTCGHAPVGLELNPDFVRIARRHGDVVEGDLRDVGNLLAEETFDGVWAQASLVHLDADEARAVLSAFGSLLRTNGKLYACVSATGTTGWLDEADGRRWYHVWEPDIFAAAVAQAGFVVDETTAGPYVEVWATRSG